ncbi:hypothetical protein [Dickeya chrysanthemi]|nr:hypothetical protein [Dickeya chrysanthemi]
MTGNGIAPVYIFATDQRYGLDAGFGWNEEVHRAIQLPGVPGAVE